MHILQHSLRMVAKKKKAIVIGIQTPYMGKENAAFLTDSPSTCYQPYKSTNICLFPCVLTEQPF